MKKIRLLAILLAMLMIPFSMFFACDNTEELGDDDVVDDDDDGDDAPTAPIVLDDDGSNPDGGYLMYFHFNAAGDGRLNIIKPSTDTTKSESQYVLEAPYSTYLEGNNVQGGSFVVRTKDDRSFLAIERVDANTRPTLSIKVGEAFTDDIDADHMLRFDLFFENGHFGSAVDVYGGKNSAKNTFTFLTVENGDQKPVIKDAVGNVVYGDKETDKTGWIDVAILISEQTRKYDIYIDGIKQTDGVGLNSAYPAWNDYRVETYNIAIRNVGMTNTFCYIDDLCMKNGNESNLGIYKGVDGGDEFVGKVPSYVDVLSLTKEHVLDLYTEKNAGTKVKSSVFSSSLLMSNVLTITKITTAEGDNRAEDVFEDTMIDYGVETGAYDEVSYFYKEGSDEYYAAWVEVEPSSYVGGHANIQQLGKIVYDADKKDATPAVEGVYTIAANGNITFTWSEENKTYAKYDATAKTLTIYSDEACTTAVDGAVYTLYDAEPYANVAYATVNVADKIKLQVSPFFKTAKLSVTPAQGTALEGEYPCDVDGNVVTVEVDSETSFTFTYNEEDDEFVYGTGIKLNKVVEADILEDNQKYALKWANFLTGFETSGRYYPEFDAEWWANNYQNYHNFSFEFYATEEMVNDGFRFMLVFDCGKINNANTYYQVVFDTQASDSPSFVYEEGWNSFSFDIVSYNNNANCALNLINSVSLTTRGWANGPAIDIDGDRETPNDGYALYISKMAFYKNVNVDLEHPSEDNATCKHVGNPGEDLFEKVSEPVPANCQHGAYYIERCSNCGTTRIDTTMPVGMPVDHNTSVEGKTVPSTCTEGGYNYHECLDCGEHVVDSYTKATGHDEVQSPDWDNKVITYTCSVCGMVREMHIYDALIPMSQKVVDATVNGYFFVSDTVNNAIDYKKDTFTGQGSLSEAKISCTEMTAPIRHASLKSVEVAGRVAIEIKHLDTYNDTIKKPDGSIQDSNHTYWNFRPGIFNKDFVFEVDVMLGATAQNGKYSQQQFQVIDRSRETTDGARRDFVLFTIGTDGVLKINATSGNSPTYQLSNTEFTNVAFVFSATNNTVALYIDGEPLGEPVPFKGHSLHQNAADVIIDEFRYNFGTGTGVFGASHYFSGVCWYQASAPICVITEIDIAEEATGDIVLKDDIGNPMVEDFPVKQLDVNSYLDIHTLTSKYVIEFTLDGEDLADGAILKGTKRGTGFDRYENLISIKDGKVYCIDKLISMTTENVKLALVVDDTVGAITVYINGEPIDGTISYSNADYAFYDAFTPSYIRGLTFLKECGEYTVSGFKMYTGTSVKE